MTNADEKFYEAYKIAIAARNFHYENFNKWMNFFYVAVGAIFIAYYNVKDDELKPMLSLFGLIVSFLGYLSCKGYYYWIYNWTWQLIRFENELEEKYKVYSVISEEVKKPLDKMLNPLNSANISTSKMSLIFFLIICSVWSYLTINLFWGNSLCWTELCICIYCLF